MSSSTKKLSWPVAAVAVLALVLASLATVGGSYAAAGVTAKQAKKIAGKVVKNKAKKLSVKHAKTADNASKLGGKAPGAYLDRVAVGAVNGNQAVAAGTQQLMNPEAINVPAGVSFVRVDAVASFSTGNALVSVWISENTCVAAGDDYDYFQLGSSANQSSVSVMRVFEVTPGQQGYRLCVNSSAVTSVGRRAMTLQTVAVDGS